MNYFKECMKHNTSNVLICPDNDELPMEIDPYGYEDLAALNRELRKIKENIKSQFSRKIEKIKKERRERQKQEHIRGLNEGKKYKSKIKMANNVKK